MFCTDFTNFSIYFITTQLIKDIQIINIFSENVLKEFTMIFFYFLVLTLQYFK